MSASLSPGNFGRDENDWFGGRDEEAEAAASKSLAATAARIVGAKPFPVAAKRLEELTRTSNARIEQVVVVLESDPALSARLLRLVNSAGYGLKVRCTSVRHAAVLVGTRRLNQVATTAAILDLFESSNQLAAELLEHAAVVGSLCRYLAVHLGLPHDELFTCGFLHDIGKIMLLDTEREIYPTMLRELGGSADAIHEQERRVFGFDHATLGAHVLTAWNIPEPVPKVIAWHHQPARALQDSLLSAMVQTLRLADLLAYELGRHDDTAGIALVAASESAMYLDISEPQLAAMWHDLASLRDRSRARSHGETDLEVADPRLEVPNSLRPRGSMSPRSLKSNPALTRGSIAPTESEEGGARHPSDGGKDLPKRLSCVVCGTGSYGNICQACGGHVCPNHQEGADEWCSLCADDFIEFKTRYRLPPSALTAGATVVVLSLLGSLLSAWSAGNTGPSALLAPLLLGVVWAMVLPIASKLWVKLRFMRGLSPRTPPSQSIETSGQRLQPEGQELLSTEPLDSLPIPSVVPDYDRSTLHTAAAAPIEPFAAGLAGLAQLAQAPGAPAHVARVAVVSEPPPADVRTASEPPPSSRGPMVIRVDVPSLSPQALNARLEASLSSADSQLSAMARLAMHASVPARDEECDETSDAPSEQGEQVARMPSEGPEISVGVLSMPHLRGETSITPSLIAAASEQPSPTVAESSSMPIARRSSPPAAEAPSAPVVVASGAPVVVAPSSPAAEAPSAPVVVASGAPVVVTTSTPVVEESSAPAAEMSRAPVAESSLAPASEPSEPPHDELSGVRHVLLQNERGVLRDFCAPAVAMNRCS